MARSELKKVDEAFSYNSNVNFLTIHMVQTLADMNSELAKMDELLVDAGVEGISHTDKLDDIDYCGGMFGELLAYSSDLAFYALELIDKPLYKNFNLNATESISRIKVEDYTTPNTLGIQIAYVHADESEDLDTPETLNISDFLGITAPENGGRLRGIPKEFTDFSNQYVTMYENIKSNLVDEDGNQLTLDEYLDQLVSMGEFSHTKDQPFRQFLSAVLDLTIILPIIEACTGTDYITGEDLSDFERGMKAVGAVIEIFTLGQSGILTMPAKEALMSLGKLAVVDVVSTSASYWTGYACNELGLPLPLTIILSTAMGMTVSSKMSGALFDGEASIKIQESSGNENIARKVGGTTGEIHYYTREEIIDALDGVTKESTEVANGIRNKDIKINVLGDELFESYTGYGPETTAVAVGDQLYVRNSSESLFSDVVHEGTHVNDYLSGVNVDEIRTWDGEIRAFSAERNYQIKSGMEVQFPNEDDLKVFVWKNYERLRQ